MSHYSLVWYNGSNGIYYNKTKSGANWSFDEGKKKGVKNMLLINQANGDIIHWVYESLDKKNRMVRYYDASRKMAPNEWKYS